MKSAKTVRSKNVSEDRRPLNGSAHAAAGTTPAAAGWAVWHVWAALAATIAAAFWAYLPALNGAFVFDDLYLPFQTPAAADWSLAHWLAGTRPLLMLSFWLNYRTAGDETFSYHFTNVLMHAANAALAFLVVRRLLQWSGVEDRRRTWLAGFGAGLFLLHPVQTESVAYVASRSELLSVGLLLAAFAVFLYRAPGPITWARSIAVLVLFGFAALSKEHTVVLPGLLLLADYYWNPAYSFAGIPRNWRLYVPVLAGAAVGVVLVLRVLSQATSAGFALKEFTWYQYFFTQCRVLWSYLRLFVIPYPLNVDPDVATSHSLFEPATLIGFIALLALLAAAWIWRKRYPLASFGILAALLLLAPTSSFAPLRDPMAEHRLYLPFFALTLVPIEFLRRWKTPTNTLLATLGIILLVAGALTYQRAEAWQDGLSLWKDSAAKSPRKVRPHFQYAYALFLEGRHYEACQAYAETAKLGKPDVQLLVDWALACDAAGHSDEARRYLDQALQLEPTAHVYATLGMVEAKQGHLPEANSALDRAEKLDPRFDMTYYYRGTIFFQEADFAKAVEQYQTAVRLNPRNQAATRMLDEARRRLAAAPPSAAPR